MKILKRIFIGFFALLVVALIAGLFMEKDYSIEREVVINKSKDEVYNYIKYLKNQDNYSYWNKQDPNMRHEYKGTDGTIGFISSWKGNDKVGIGAQEIKNLKEGERIDLELRFKEPMEMTNNAYMTTTDEGSSKTKVVWGFSGRLTYPMNVMMPFMGMDNVLGTQLKDGLNNLKKILEEMPSTVAAKSNGIDSLKTTK